MSITIYGFEEHINKCVPCISAKRLCDTKGVQYSFVSVAPTKDENGPILDEKVLDVLQGLTGTRKLSMPQIFEGNKRIGGFQELRQHLMKK